MTTKLNIPVNLTCHSSHYSDEQYGDWHESYSMSVGNKATILGDNAVYHSGQIEYYDGELKSGDLIAVIIANYSTGDSFGNSDGGSVEICAVHKDIELARKNLDIIKQGFPKGKHSITLTLDSGKEVTTYCPWIGYFESLNSVDIYLMHAV